MKGKRTSTEGDFNKPFDMKERENDPREEGHTKEWQDRARVVLDAKKAAGTEASPKQSPDTEKQSERGADEKDRKRMEEDDSVY